MKKFIQKILSYKKTIIVIVVIILGALYYTLTGISKNIAQLAEPSDDVDYFPTYPAVQTTAEKAEQIKRGEYLAKAGDCIACHTNSPDHGKPFAGGLPMQTPFGTIFSPNITPDKETGIGNWTDADFIKAMREGISPSGHRYYPAFPYLYFNKVTTDDLLAIKAYLDSLPPVHQPNEKNKMVWPFNWRFLQSGWRILFFNPVKTGPYKPNPHESAQWNRGAYLVEGLGHCAMCHTPSYYIFTKQLPLGAPIQKYNLTGAPIQGYLAPNISKSNLANISDEELIKVFTHNQLIGGGTIEGPMLEANQDSLRYLSHDDLLAIATYLKSVESQTPPKPKPGKGGPGQPIYENYCAGCHAAGAGNAPKYGDVSSWAPILAKGINMTYANAINGIGGMPAKGTCLSCTDQEIKQAVDYMVNAVTGKNAKAAPPPVKKLTMQDGQRIYQQNCAICHATGFKHAPKPGDMVTWKPIIDQGFLQTYTNVVSGAHGHPPRGACVDCSDAELKAAIKYMMQSSTTTENFNLW